MTEPPADVWLDPRVVVAASAIEGRGLVAAATIESGAVVVGLGGRVVSSADLAALIAANESDPDRAYVDTVTVGEDAHLVLPPSTAAHFGNHSCEPTLWYTDPFGLATRRAVAVGEELTLDYATVSGADGFGMDCTCGSPRCRGGVTADDWRSPDLQARYGDHWTPALRHRIQSPP